jgi:outer membrane protein OmpA-like peptidoglycan-associated protein
MGVFMRRLIFSSAAAIASLTAVPAFAQSAAAAPGDDVSTYLCAFAGKCDSSVAEAEDEEEAVPVKAAPATKGFRLAGASQTTAAPATKGFRLAPQQSTAPATKGFRLAGPAASTNAPPVKGFRLNRSAPAARPAGKAYATPRSAYAGSRAAYAAPRPAPAAGARADLMLNFEYNSDRMTPAAEAKARGFAKALMMPELATKRFLIEGHTDSRGARELNVDLSRRRAQSVANFLVSQGVDAARVEVKGVGPDEPLPGRSPNAEANRRVEAVLLG